MQASYVCAPIGVRPRGFFTLLGDCLRRPGGRRVLSLLTVALFIAGVGMFAYPVATDWMASQRQSALRGQFATDSGNAHYRQIWEEHQVPVGTGLTRLQIPAIGVDVVVVQGTTPAALAAGAGHYVNTPLPGERGNVAIAGHRTTYGRPFNELDQVRPGDDIILTTPFARYTYVALPPFDGHANPWPVLPTDVSVVSQDGTLATGHWLTLTTCNPKGSAAQRLILRAKLVATKMLPVRAK